MPVDAKRVQRVFLAAVEAADQAARADVLDRECGADAELRYRVEALLQAHEEPGSFLEKPAWDPKATVDSRPGQGAEGAGGSGRPEEEASAAPRSEVRGSRIGPYKLLQQIGEGGMGTVWMAEQQEPVRRLVALKVIKAGMDSAQVVARFEAERQALALMDHPHIAKVFDGGTTASGRPYFVMELVKGTPITRYCDEHRLTPRQRLELFVPVCQALQHAHQKGIIHRDVKPSNVLVAPYDGRPVVKVIDFGVAKAAGQRLTERTLFTALGAVVGTLEYMSPEQAELNNQDIDTRSDLYSLGVLLYELLTGTTPLTKQRLQQVAFTEMLRLIREEEPPKPSTRLSESKDSLPSVSAQRHMEPAKLTKLVRGELDWIVMKALEKDRGRRYETASGLARDLERYLADEPVEACSPSAGYRLRKYARKHRRLLATAAAFALLLVLGAVLSTWQAVRATRAEAQALDNAATARAAAAAEAAQRQRAEDNERQAKLTLTDMYTSQGLMAGEREGPAQAVLWFANAARLAGAGTERERANRARLASWARQAFQPVRALQHKADWISSLQFHPSGQYVLTQTRLLFGPKDELMEGDWTLWDVAQEVPLALPAGVGSASSAAWSADGRWLALGTPRGDVLLCSFPDGQVHQRLAYGGRIHALSFSPEGRFLAIASANTVGSLVMGKVGSFSGLSGSLNAYQALGLALASPTWSGPSLPSTVLALRVFPTYTVRVWDCPRGAFATPELKHPMPVAAVAFHPQGHRLATSCWDQQVRVFAIPNEAGEPLFAPVAHLLTSHPLTGLSGPPTFIDSGRGLLTTNPPVPRALQSTIPVGLVGSPGGQGSLLAASALLSGTVLFAELAWRHAETGAVIRSVSFPRPSGVPGFSPVSAVTVSRDGKYFTVEGAEAAQTWEIATGQAVSPLSRSQPASAAFVPDGRTLLTGSTDRPLRGWSLPSGQALGRPLAHRISVHLPAFSPDGRLLATAQRGGLVRLWAAPADNPRNYSVPLDGKGSLAKLSRDGRYLLATGQERLSTVENPRVYEVGTGQPAGPPLEAGGILVNAAFSPDGRQVATLAGRGWLERRRGPQPGQVLLWDWRTGKRVCDPLPLPSEPLGLDYSPDGQRLAVLCSSGEIVMIHPLQARITLQWEAYPRPFLIWARGIPGMVRFSPDGQSLVTYNIDSKVRVWEATTGQPRYAALAHDGHDAWRCRDAQFSPDGRLLATAAQDGTVRIWDFATGRPLIQPLPHPDYAMAAVFSPDGQQVLTACRDGMAYLWDWRTGQHVCPPFQHEHELLAVAFTPDGRWLLTGGADKTLRVWEWRTGKPVTLPRPMGGEVASLAVTPDGNYVVAGGRSMDALQVIHLGDLSSRNELDADDLCTWAELVSGQQVQEGGVTNLTPEKWLERWQQFRRRHPAYHRVD